MLTMHQIIKNMLEHLEIDKAEILESNYPEDTLNEIVDGWIPVYHSQLADLLASKPSLGDGPSDSGIVKENPTVWDILSAAVYEALSEEANEWFSQAQTDAEESES
jgi:hypothetical protein